MSTSQRSRHEPAGVGLGEGSSRLTVWDQRLIEPHLEFYQALDRGQRTPTTPAQEHFVRVCRQQARPRTQHEIAYTRYLDAIARGKKEIKGSGVVASTSASELAVDGVSLDRAIAIVDELEELRFQARRPGRRRAFDSIVSLYRQGVARCRSISSDASAWAIALLSDPTLSGEVERWTGQVWGGLSDAYSKAIDGSYIDGLRAGADYVSPWLHRLFEGHGFPESWAAVRDALPTDSVTEEVIGWIRALASDAVTPAGLPVCTLTPERYEALKCLAQHFAIPEEWLRDALTFTGTELVAGMLPGITLAMNWNKQEAAEFAKVIGSLGVGAVVSANPVLAVVALAVLARGFQAARHGTAPADWARGMAEGGAMTGAVLAVSAAVGGPAIVGVVAGIGLAAGISSLRKSGDLSQAAGWLRGLVRAAGAAAEPRGGFAFTRK